MYKPSESKIRLKIGSDIHRFLHNVLHSVSLPSLLQKLTTVSLVKAYYAIVQPEHWTCKRYDCSVEQAILSELRLRDQIMLLRSCVDFENLEVDDEYLPFFQ